MHSTVKQSALVKVIYELSDWILSVLPNELKQFLDELSYRKVVDVAHETDTAIKETVKDLGTLSTKSVNDVVGGEYTVEQNDQLNRVLEAQSQKQNYETEVDTN